MVKQLYVGCVRLEWYVKMPGRFERRSLRLAARSVTVRFEVTLPPKMPSILSRVLFNGRRRT